MKFLKIICIVFIIFGCKTIPEKVNNAEEIPVEMTQDAEKIKTLTKEIRDINGVKAVVITKTNSIDQNADNIIESNKKLANLVERYNYLEKQYNELDIQAKKKTQDFIRYILMGFITLGGILASFGLYSFIAGFTTVTVNTKAFAFIISGGLIMSCGMLYSLYPLYVMIAGIIGILIIIIVSVLQIKETHIIQKDLETTAKNFQKVKADDNWHLTKHSLEGDSKYKDRMLKLKKNLKLK